MRHESVIGRLFAQPHRYGFFQAVRLLQRWFAMQEQLHGAAVFEQRLQFRNSLSLSFPASEIAGFDVQWQDGAEPARPEGATAPQAAAVRRLQLTPAFMGLLGAGGAMPLFYTELFARRELYDKDPAGRAFLDIFLHRAVVLFYQAWRKHRLGLQFEDDRRHQFLPMVLAVAGLGQLGLRDRLRPRDGGVSDDALAYYAGALQQRPVSAAMLRQVLSSYFDVPVRVEQFVGRWFALPLDNQTRLGMVGAAPLGAGAVMGERIWQRDLRLRLTIGPMSQARFRRFLPGGPAALALKELLTLMSGVTLEYEVRLALRADDVQATQLGGPGSTRLGWDSFLSTRPAANDRLDAGYQIHAVA